MGKLVLSLLGAGQTFFPYVKELGGRHHVSDTVLADLALTTLSHQSIHVHAGHPLCFGR